MEWTDEKIKMRLAEIKKDVKANGIMAKGRKELLAFCDGEKSTMKGAIYAHCYQCLGYQDNPGDAKDCENPVCPLYPFMPYSPNRQKRFIMTNGQKEKTLENLGKKRRLAK